MPVFAHADGRRLGGNPSPPDPRDLKFANFVKPTITLKAPKLYGHRAMSERYQPWHMLGNGPDDTVQTGFGGAGDCVLADAGHHAMLVNATHGVKVNITGKQVIKAYSDVTGYVLGDPSTDNGTSIRDALKYRKNHGLIDADGKNHKIGAYVSIDLSNDTELLQSIYVCESLSLGFSCPDYIFDQFDTGQTWTVIPGHGTIGGHDILLVGHRSLTDWACVSWAKVQRLTLEFAQHFGFELWGMISPEQLNGQSRTVDGFLYADLLNAVKQFGPVQ